MNDLMNLLLRKNSPIVELNLSACLMPTDCLIAFLNLFYKSENLQRLSLGFQFFDNTCL